jgi:glycosyltransferase involved in cell wall biosynthesis
MYIHNDEYAIFHICPGYLQTALYHKLFIALGKFNVNNFVYVPSNSEKRYVSYKLEFLDKYFSIVDRLLFYGKQKIIYNDIMEKNNLRDINVVHAHTLFSAGYIAYCIYKCQSIKYIVAVRNTDVNIFFKYMIHLRKLGVDIMENADKIIFLSEAYKKTVITKYFPESKRDSIEKKSLVIPNGIDDYFLKNKYYMKNISDINTIKLIYIGELTKNKNIKTTIKASKYLQDMGYKVNYIIVGEIKNFNIKPWINKYTFISYYPECKKEQVLQYMRAADIFVMPSITETFGLVYPEAMSQGLPIIYTKGQGFDGYFREGEVGFSVDCFNYKILANKIIEIYSNYSSISERCIQYVDRFDWEKIAMEYKEIYDNI